MVGAQRAVLLGATAKLAERHHDNAVGQFRGGEVVEEGMQGTREFPKDAA